MTLWVGIVGTRERDSFEDFIKVYEVFQRFYSSETVIVSGGCEKGADSFAYFIHKIDDVPYLEYPAQWTKLGKRAGFARNSLIANRSEILIACISPSRKGGTEDTIKCFLNNLGISEKEAIEARLLILV